MHITHATKGLLLLFLFIALLNESTAAPISPIPSIRKRQNDYQGFRGPRGGYCKRALCLGNAAANVVDTAGNTLGLNKNVEV
ncbi:11423_t:CDS:2 [Ambispora gerdemannii]|uniref:11423_t:CDS:1 n=1 Tax=Ambispora gerdemannii TaxID=144530 RepID=A0A9N9BVX8_9GLOM|nr:11423_t:CDS:2 [Ambispora gerdemannii]